MISNLIILFFSFFKISMVSFGGGMAMLPYIEYVALSHNLINDNNFVDIIGISQIAPGPISLNTVTYIGFINYGVLGAIIASLSMITASYILVILVHKFIMNSKIDMMKIIMKLKPLMIAFIFKAFLNTAEKSLLNIKDISIFLICSILLYYKKNTIVVLMIALILGVIF